MIDDYRDNGRDCECPICGKKWHVNDTTIWACKRETGGRKSHTIYFCRINCMWAYDDLQKKQEIQEALCSDTQNCIKCRYFNTDEFGFYYCTATAIVVNPGKKGCRKWKERVVTDPWYSSIGTDRKAAASAGMTKSASGG